jgi:hypothetical protein
MLKIKFAWITFFAIAMAHVEAVVVVYLRGMFKDPRIFFGPPYYFIEQTREAAIILMLVTFAFLIGKSLKEKIGAFLLAFGIWEIFYYIFLYIILRWPPSLFTIDILFLIPKPWVAPVILPIGISIIMVCLGSFLIVKESQT